MNGEDFSASSLEANIALAIGLLASKLMTSLAHAEPLTLSLPLHILHLPSRPAIHQRYHLSIKLKASIAGYQKKS